MEKEKNTPAKKDSPSKEKKGIPPAVSKILSILVLILLGTGVAFGAYTLGKDKQVEESPTPSPTAEATLELVDEDDAEVEEDTEEITPTPTSTPEDEPEKKADLYITEYSFDPTPEKQVEFTVRIGIKNQGDADSGPFYWEWWPTAHSYACRERIDDGIGAGGERMVTCTYTYGGWSTYPTKAVDDSENEVDESDEGNNEKGETVIPIH